MKVALVPFIAVALGSSMALAQSPDDPVFCGAIGNPAPGTFHARCRDAQQQVAGQCTPETASFAESTCGSSGSGIGICIGCNDELIDVGAGPVYDILKLRTGSDRGSADKAFGRICRAACSLFAMDTAWSTLVRNSRLAQCVCTEPNRVFPDLPLPRFVFSDVKGAQPATPIPTVPIPTESASAPAPAAPPPAAPATPSEKEPTPGANVPIGDSKATDNFGVQGYKAALGPAMAVACVATAMMF
ncbi:hypothetical protein BC832DRAFT_390624 [Gaertneriomyces semiglobifer]|nr:hypothetical protein BC832DRAFT_390624 [Gaertneriomyces semiglobifer]